MNTINKKADIKSVDNSIFSDNTKRRAIDFIAEKEGLRTSAYKDTKGIWTIGYGHTKGVKEGDKITKEQALKFLFDDFFEHAKPLKYVKIQLSENQKIALSSFIFNVGANAFVNSTLLKKLNTGNITEAAEEFERWIYEGKRPSKGLLNRRKSEKALFLKPDNGN